MQSFKWYTVLKKALGRLERVDLREYWKCEPQDFTPWLAENISRLGQALDLELEVESQEKSVGTFQADLLCSDTRGNWVIIENQLERTDHTHLGQLLTYAAGLDAKTVIWVAERFTEEHRAALDRLNEITQEDFHFFGVEIELWRIGDSLAAPKFNIVCRPNDWSKSVRESAKQISELSDTRRTQLEFWTDFKAYLEKQSHIRCQNPRAQAWMIHTIGRSAFYLASVASTWNSVDEAYTGEQRVELVMDGPHAKQYFELLMAEKEAIEDEAQEPLIWHSLPDTKKCRIYVRTSADVMDRDSWPVQHERLKEKLELLYSVFTDRVKSLIVA